jgi:hypothetical protein
MFFLNLSLPEFLAILGSLSGVMVALYLLDRLRKRHTVATLRFFAAAEKPPVLKHRRKLQQPWSLLLQLLSLLLLLLAIAQLRLGSPARYSRDHVLIIDSSAWMAARGAGNVRLIDRARLAADNYVNALPPADRVMVVRADVLATPALLFETDRKKIHLAIDQTQPGVAPLNLEQALDFAAQAQKVQAQRPGEIVFVGAGRIPAGQAARLNAPPNFRLIAIDGPTEHVGLRKISVHRAMDDPDVWEVFIAAKNYGAMPRSVPMTVTFGGSPVATHRFDLKPAAEDDMSFRFKTRAAGWLEARLATQDAFRQDSRAILELPRRGVLPVTVYSAEPDLLRPIFTAIPGVQASFLPVASYTPDARGGIVLLDHFAPPSPPQGQSIWLEPPPSSSPVPVESIQPNVKLNQWQADHPLAAGLRAREIELASAEIFRPASGDIVVARSDAGPVIVARSESPKMVVLGFHPVRSGMRYQLTTPLLFANIVRWMAPDAFRSWELTAGTVGTVDVDLESEIDPNSIRVQTEEGRPLPFTVQGKALRFFTGAPGVVRVLTGDRELVYSLTLPQPGDTAWKPSNVKLGVPGRAPLGPTSRDLWHWLALAGAAGLLADWILYGRIDRRMRASQGLTPGQFWRKAS